MSLTSIRHLLNWDNLDRAMGYLTFLVRIALIICILLSAAFLTIAPFTDGDADNSIKAFFFFATFYSVIWGTIPSMFLLIAIVLDNRYRKKTRPQPVKVEIKLLIINIVIILFSIMIIGIIRLNK